MQEQEPSRTALGAALHRAAHQLLEDGLIFRDPLAIAIVGKSAEEIIEDGQAPSRRGMRAFVAARSRLAETRLAEGVRDRGVRQLVVLGAGLDTFAYRNPFSELRVFEVDHPATQAWKRRRLAEAGVAVPASVVFAPVDFEREALSDGLARAGVEPGQRTFVMWLGVVPYLTLAAIRTSLGVLGGFAGGAEVVFDYGEPPASLPPELRAMHEARAARVAEFGEPFLSYFDPADLRALLVEFGFRHVEDRNPRTLLAPYLGQERAAGLPDRGGHVVFTATEFG